MIRTSFAVPRPASLAPLARLRLGLAAPDSLAPLAQPGLEAPRCGSTVHSAVGVGTTEVLGPRIYFFIGFHRILRISY